MTLATALLTRPAIDAAARALYLNSPIHRDLTDREGIWDRMPEATKNQYRDQAEAGIHAALAALQ